MSDYTPTTQVVRLNYITANAGPYRGGAANAGAAFDRWLEQYTAQKRAEWEAEQGEVEWEYGWAGDRHATVFYASKKEAEEFMGAPKKFARRRAGEWQEA